MVEVDGTPNFPARSYRSPDGRYSWVYLELKGKPLALLLDHAGKQVGIPNSSDARAFSNYVLLKNSPPMAASIRKAEWPNPRFDAGQVEIPTDEHLIRIRYRP